MTDLLERIEAATEGSRELDKDIASQVHPGTDWDKRYTANVGWGHPDFNRVMRANPVPHYTTSIDAALTLVPEGWGFKADCGLGYGNECTVGHVGENKMYDQPDGWAKAATPALALCAASLRAREAQP